MISISVFPNRPTSDTCNYAKSLFIAPRYCTLSELRLSSDSQNRLAPKTLRRQFSWTLPANVLYGGCTFLIYVVLNKVGGPSVAGDYTAALAATAPIFMCANLRFSTMLASDTSSTVFLADYFKVRGLLLVGALATISLLLMTRGQSGIGMVVLLVALTKSVEAFSELCCGVQQCIERMDRIAFSLAANGLCIIIAFAGTFFITKNLTYAVLSMLFARLIVLFAYDIPIARVASHQPRFQAEEDNRDRARLRMRSLLLAAAPLGITAALVSLTTNIPRYVIPIVFDREMLGIFGSCAVTLQAGSLIFRAIELPATPKLAQLIKQRDGRGFWRLQGKLCAMFVAMGLMGAITCLAIGPQLLTIAYTARYASLGGVLALMALSTCVGQIAGLIESSLIAARVIAVQVPMHCLTAVSCLVLCVVLIPAYHLYGAVLAVTICRIPFVLIGVWLLRQKLKQPVDEIGNKHDPVTETQRRAA